MDGRERSTLEKWSRVKALRRYPQSSLPQGLHGARELPFSQQDHDNNNNTKRSDLPGWACCFRRRPRPRRVGSWNTLTFTAARGRPRSHARSEISGETPAGLGVTGWNQCCRSWRFRDKNLRFARVTAETPLTIGSQFLSLQRETILRLVFKERVQERERARSDQKPLERPAIRAQRSIPLDPTTRAR